MMLLYPLLLIMLGLFLLVLLWPLRGHKAVPIRKRRRFIACIIVLFTTLAFGLYPFFGAPEILPMLAERQEKLVELRQSIVNNSEAVKKDSKNLAAWVGLGQDFMDTGQYSAATNAFRQAVLLSEGNPKLLLAYAQAMIADESGTVSDAAYKALQMVLLQEPKNPQATYFVAVYHLQEGKTQEAMAMMKELYRSLPKDAPLRATINRQIGREN